MHPLRNDLTKSLVQEEIGKRIRAARKARGWSQTALAVSCRLHVSHLSKIERGGANVTGATLLAITTALQIDLFEPFRDICVPELLQKVREAQTMSTPQATAKLT